MRLAYGGEEDESSDAVGLPSPAERETGFEEESLIIAAAHKVAEETLKPNAQISDLAEGPRIENFRALAQAGLLGIAIPKKWGGLDVSGPTQREITEILASACGVTTFIQAQHHGPSRMIANCPNETLKQRLLPELATGKMMCAVSFAHLRRPGPPVLKAEPVSRGYRITGVAPWVTGWGLMNQVVFGATLPDEKFVYLWVPADRKLFEDLFEGITPPERDWGRMSPSDPIRLCVMNASATVELNCQRLFVPDIHCLHFSDREAMKRNDRNGVLGAAVMPIGCAAGSIQLLSELSEKRNIPAIRRAYNRLLEEWKTVRDQVHHWINDKHSVEDAIKLRAQVIQLAVRCAHAACAASSGSANLLSHPAQRLYREAMFYTIQAQTQEVMDATLKFLEAKTEEDKKEI